MFNFPGLGTHWWFEIWDNIDEPELKKIAQALYQATVDFEKKFSRFESDSLIATLNSQRTLDTTDKEFLSIITYGQSMFTRTDGVFNMLTGNILETRGYGNVLKDSKKALSNKPGNPLEDIVITSNKVQLLGESYLDIGGYGKGWLIDKLAVMLHQELGCKEFLINGGGDIYASEQSGKSVEVYKEDPVDTKKIIGTIKIKNQGFAGSSPHKRTWKKYNATGEIEQYNHIVASSSINVKNGACVVANTAVDADAFATTLLQLDDVAAQKLAMKEGFTIV